MWTNVTNGRQQFMFKPSTPAINDISVKVEGGILFMNVAAFPYNLGFTPHPWSRIQQEGDYEGCTALLQ